MVSLICYPYTIYVIPICKPHDSTTMIVNQPQNLDGLVPRILELTSRITPWHRRNWRAGTLEIVEEMLNEALVPGTQERALKEMKTHMTNVLVKDEGAASIKKYLLEHVNQINASATEASYAVQVTKKFAKELRASYLQNWANVFEDSSKAGTLDIEGTAKRIVSHVLYCGIPESSIYRFFSDIQNSSEEFTFAQVLRKLDEREKRRKTEFSFAVPVTVVPEFLFESREHENWLKAQDLKKWKHQYAPNAKKVRYQGGFLISVKARDVDEAAEEVRRQLAQLAFKFWVGSENRFAIAELMWSKEKGSAFTTGSVRGSEPLKLRAFRRSGTLHELSLSPRIRNILAIIEPLKKKDDHVAIVNGWTAIEALLVDADSPDFVGAERIAFVIAASYFRSEFVWLAKNYVEKYAANSDAVRRIRNAETSFDRACRMADVVREQHDFGKLSPVDQLAVSKMQKALRKPREEFDRTHKIIAREFQRLYRKRNLIIHSGRAVEYGIESTVKNVIPMLINGIDQLLIAELQNGIDPKGLVAHIEYRSNMLPQDGQENPYALLELLENIS